MGEASSCCRNFQGCLEIKTKKETKQEEEEEESNACCSELSSDRGKQV